MKRFIFGLSLIAVLGASSQAVDKNWIATHLKKNFNIDPKTSIVVGDFIPSPLGDLLVGTVTIGTNNFPLYLTKDEANYFWGQVFSLAVDPDKERESKMNLKDVRAKGSPKAKVTVVEYTDLQCPWCQKAHEMVSTELYKAYTKDQVRWVFKHFPLNMHEYAEPTAVAAECAGEQKPQAFWDMTDGFYAFFKDAKDIKKEMIEEKKMTLAEQLKLNKAKFEKCLQAGKDGAAYKRVQADRQEGIAVGVGGTPTFYVNGRMVRGGKFEDMKAVIDEKLHEAKQ